MKVVNIRQLNSFIQHLTSTLNIESVICYGSYAAGLQDKRSDIDLLVLMQKLPSSHELQKMYQGVPDIQKIENRDLSHWDNTWSLHNATLDLGGLKIDLGYNTLFWVKKVAKKLLQDNQISFKELLFRPYTFLGLLEHSQCLYDKRDFIKKIKSTIRPFPLGLKKEIVKSFLPIMNDCYVDLVDNLQRDLGILAFQFHVFIGLDAIIQLLWVINDVYDPASKRTEFYLFKLKVLPKNFKDFIQDKLARSYLQQKEFVDAFAKVKEFLEEKTREFTD